MRIWRMPVVILVSCGLAVLLPRYLCAQQASVGAPKVAGPTISYTLPKDGEVTLGIYDQQGRLLRTVISSEPRSQGKLVETWDGLDQWGKPLPAGSYVVKGIYHPPITTQYVMSFGNAGNPPWPTVDGKGDWFSDESAPQAVVSDGQWVFIGSPGAEKGSTIAAVDANGQRQWGITESFNPVTISLAVDGDYLYALFSGPKLTDATHAYRPGGANAIGRAVLICLEKRTGRFAKFTIKEPVKEIGTFPFTGATVGIWDLRAQKSFSPENYSGLPRYGDSDAGETTSAIGLAVSNHRVYVSMRDSNQVLVLDADSAAKVDQISVPSPAGLFAAADHSILAVSGKQVVRISPASKQIQPVISAGLTAPRAVTSDTKGRIFVSDWANSFQVKLFSASGAPIRSIGQEGGRPWLGPWKTNGMLLPTGIAVNGDGKLWVAEDDNSPKRVSVWNPDTGAFLKEYLGPAPYGGPGSVINPKDATDGFGAGTRFKLSFAAKSWTPESTPERRMDLNQPFALNGATPAEPGQRVLYHGGQEYQTVVSSDLLVIHKRNGDLLVPVAAMGSLGPQTGDGTARTIWDSDLGRRFVENMNPPFFKGHAGDNYTWTDSSGDGLVQAPEMQWQRALSGSDAFGSGTQPTALTPWGIGIADDWSIYWSGSYKGKSYVFRLDVKGWTSDGAPIYDIHDSKPIVVLDSVSAPLGIFGTNDGKVIVTYNYEFGPFPPNAIECFDRDGKSLWSLAMPKAPPLGHGQGPKDILAQNVIHEFKVPGLGNVLGSWLWHGNAHPYLFTDDGLYVESLLEDSNASGPNTAGVESYKAYYQDPQGTPYIINGGTDAFHILKIGGLDQGGRFQTTLNYTPQDTSKAVAYRAAPVVKVAPRPIVNVPWAAQPPTIDGNLGDWNLHTGVVLQGDKGRAAQVALSRDGQNLYLAYHVTKDRPFSNKADNWQTLFLSGDCVDLMLSTDLNNPRHSDPAQGDLRLLMSIYQGKPVAVLYRPVVSGTGQPVQLAAARIDDIRQLASAKVVIVPSGNSYNVEASVPLKDLGLDAKSIGATLRGDVGVVYADASGSSRALRLYYSNKKTSMTADLTTEATLQPGEWGPVQLPLGANLLKDSSFENGLAANSSSGWASTAQQSGGAVAVNTASPHSGIQSLMLSQSKPIVYPATALALPDYQAFLKSSNNGAGPGVATVEQQVPVTGGHLYNFRFNYRSENIGAEKTTPGPGRGYVSIQSTVEWVGPGLTNDVKFVRTLDGKIDAPDWQQLTDPTFPFRPSPQPYRAPAGATAVVIQFRLVTYSSVQLPTVYLDDVELVDAGVAP